ncbi:MAG: hypothetical protein H6937_13350 [Burkholderiales bacterium]|nr:hypothetical protein [Burkholderiales bacterium]
MDDFVLARVVHVLSVVLWIGGVAMVTLILLPVLKQMASPGEAMTFFISFRRRFAAQARLTTLLVGLSGFYMTFILDAWHRFVQWQYWWMHTMVLIWLLFTFMLFVTEPKSRKQTTVSLPLNITAQTFSAIQRRHLVLLILSLLTIAGAVAGSHGWLIPGGD